MRFVITVFAVAAGALSLAVGSVVLALDERYAPFVQTIGAWRFVPDVNALSADPYSSAYRVRRDIFPATGFDSVSMEATRDDEGRRLDGACTYRLAGSPPPARFWTLSVHGASRPGEAEPPRRSSFSSAEILRADDGTFAIHVSSRALPGNWLPVEEGRFRLALNLYETAIGSNLGAEAVFLPDIERVACR